MDTVNSLIALFSEKPTKWGEIKTVLSSQELSKEELARIAISLTDDCFGEYRDALDPKIQGFSVENMHSQYLLNALQTLLDFGLNPNTIVDDENVMWNLQWVDAPNIGAAALRLMLENGGNPNHRIPAEHETLFEDIAFEVSYDMYTHEYFHTVQCWLVLMAYGGCWDDGNIPLTMHEGCKVEMFKDFELFDYTIEPLPQDPKKYGCWIMHIFNKQTNQEVALYK